MANTDVLVITGGAGGMGLACACKLADRGHLLLVDVDDAQLAEARSMLSAQGASVDTLQCDVISPAEVAAVADRVRASGRFRCLVHTMSVSPEMTDARTVIEVDLVGSVRITDAVFPLVGPGSSAILFGSIAGYSDVDPAIEKLLCDPLADGLFSTVERALGQPIDSATSYVLAKRGVMRLAERLAKPWGARGGRVVAISPGLINTAMGRLELERQPIIPQMIELTPVKRPGPLPGRTDDIAALVAFLESDAAAFISGCDIRVDGGLVGAAKHMLGGG
ncbi:SDR family oxidoreductase [Mycobacterium sp.]|uniref:SDR family oxidoreductase n=1 Tax=Mycobacterium sp. TaxID=1785 RepID=UPI003C772414